MNAAEVLEDVRRKSASRLYRETPDDQLAEALATKHPDKFGFLAQYDPHRDVPVAYQTASALQDVEKVKAMSPLYKQYDAETIAKALETKNPAQYGGLHARLTAYRDSPTPMLSRLPSLDMSGMAQKAAQATNAAVPMGGVVPKTLTPGIVPPGVAGAVSMAPLVGKALSPVGGMAKNAFNAVDQSNVSRSLGAGAARIYSGLARVPNLASNVFALPYNAVAEMAGRPDLAVKSPKSFEREAKWWDQKAQQLSIGHERWGSKGETFVDVAKRKNPKEISAYLVYKVLEEAPQQAIIIGATLAGSPAAGLAYMGTSAAAQEQAKGDGSGASPAWAAVNSVVNGMAEAAFEMTPALMGKWSRVLEGSFGKKNTAEIVKNVVKTIASSFVQEGLVEEGTTELFQSISQKLTGVDPNAMKGLLDRVIESSVTGGMMGAGMTAPAAIAQGYLQSKINGVPPSPQGNPPPPPTPPPAPPGAPPTFEVIEPNAPSTEEKPDLLRGYTRPDRGPSVIAPPVEPGPLPAEEPQARTGPVDEAKRSRYAQSLMDEAHDEYQRDREHFDKWKGVIARGIRKPADLRGEFEDVPLWMQNQKKGSLGTVEGKHQDEAAEEAVSLGLISDPKDFFDHLRRVKAPTPPSRHLESYFPEAQHLMEEEAQSERPDAAPGLMVQNAEDIPFQAEKQGDMFPAAQENVGQSYERLVVQARKRGLPMPEAMKWAKTRLAESAKGQGGPVTEEPAPMQRQFMAPGGVQGFGAAQRGQSELFSATTRNGVSEGQTGKSALMDRPSVLLGPDSQSRRDLNNTRPSESTSDLQHRGTSFPGPSVPYADSITRHPDYVKMSRMAEDVAEEFGPRFGIQRGPNSGEQLYRKMHDIVHPWARLKGKKNFAALARLEKRYGDIPSAWKILTNKMWMDGSQEYFEKRIAGNVHTMDVPGKSRTVGQDAAATVFSKLARANSVEGRFMMRLVDKITPANDVGFSAAYGEGSKGYKILGQTIPNQTKNGLTFLMEFSRFAREDTGAHEFVHGIRRLGWFRPGEWETLAEHFGKTGQSEAMNEEAVANGTAAYIRDRGTVKVSRVRAILDRLIQMIRRVRNWAKGQGFRTAEDVMEDVVKGRPIEKGKETGGGSASMAEKETDKTQTPAFRKWFGNSVVTDTGKPMSEGGTPLVVYHVTDSKFTKFNPRKSAMGGIFWFTSDKGKIESGETGAGLRPGKKQNVIDAYLSIQKMAGREEYEKYGIGELKGLGYDGIRLEDDYVVFGNTQIKSATGNSGSFDPQNPSILYQAEKGPTIRDDKAVLPNGGYVPLATLSKLRRFYKEWLTTERGVGSTIDRANEERIGRIMETAFDAPLTGKELLRYFKENPSEDLRQAVFDALTGRREISSLPSDIVKTVQKMRDDVDALSRSVAEGATPNEKLKDVIERNLGRYLGRYYKLFERKKWRPSVEVIERAKAKMRELHPQTLGQASESELNGIIEGILSRGDTTFHRGDRRVDIPQNHFIKRKDIPTEIRELYGEITDPVWAYLKTMSDQAVVAHNARFLGQASKVAGAFQDKASQTHFKQIPDTARWGAVRGKFTTPELNDFLIETIDPVDSGLFRFVEKFLVNPFKWTKTVGSLPSHPRNFLGNTMFSILSGNAITNPMNAPHYWKALRVIADKGGQYRETWKELVRARVADTQYWGSEMPKMMAEMISDPISWPDKIIEMGKWPIEKLGQLYNSEDLIYRVSAFLKYRDNGMTVDQAAKEVDRWFTNYARLPKGVKLARRVALFGPFLSFKANTARILYNAAKEAGAGMKKGNPAPALRLAFVLSFTPLLQKIMRGVFDIDDDEKEKLDKLQDMGPVYKKNSTPIYYKTDANKIKAFDLGYIWPTGDFDKAIRAALRGDVDSLVETIDLFQHPLFDAYSVLFNNYNTRTRRTASNPNDPMTIRYADKAAELLRQIYVPASSPIPSIPGLAKKRYEPGVLTGYQIKNLYDAYNGVEDRFGRTRELPEELRAFATGIRTWEIRPDDILRSFQFRKRGETIEAKRELNRSLRMPGISSDEKARRIADFKRRMKNISSALNAAGDIGKK